jgi:hypothetical protein
MKTDEQTTVRRFSAQVTEDPAETGILSADRIRVGQMLAQMQLEEMIGKTQRWARDGRLNRGLSLTLPFFDDVSMEICWRELQVIPPGRVLFIPAFVVIAARAEGERVAAEAGLSATTREHLLGQLRALERAFVTGAAGRAGLP